jgi:hypothetical protein
MKTKTHVISHIPFKSILFLFVLLLTCLSVRAQNLEVDGKAKITVMDKVNTADSVVVRLPDGTLAVRDVSSLPEDQILSISNDTVYLTDGGFVKLPADNNAGWTMNSDTISTLKKVSIGTSAGIGTSAPNTKLFIQGDGGLHTLKAGSSTLSCFTQWLNHDFSLRGIVGADGVGFSGNANQFSIATWTNHPIAFFTNTSQRMTISNTGNVGIGTENPSTKLHVKGNTRIEKGRLDLLDSTGNVAVGHNALGFTTTGSLNVATGWAALFSNSTGSRNVANGPLALGLNTTGIGNVAVGDSALLMNTTGSHNTAIGFDSGVSSGALTNATAIGANAVVNASDKVRIGDGSVSVIEGAVAFSPTSDRRLKEDIRPISLGKTFINDLNPVQYHRINNINNDVEAGLIAQELLAVLEKHGMSLSGMVSMPNDPNQHMSVRYNDLFAPLIKAIQELSEENELLKAEVSRIDTLEQTIASIQAILSEVMNLEEDKQSPH